MTPPAPYRLLRRACWLWLCAACIATPAAAASLMPWDGGPAPALVLNDMSGVRHDLSRYRGKVVLVNFWATWCAPCRAEMPSMDRLRERHAKDAFVVLAVNVDEPEQRIRNFLGRIPLGFTVLPDPGMRVTRDWSARVLPASFLIGRDGRIRYSVRGEVDWTSEPVLKLVRRLLRES